MITVHAAAAGLDRARQSASSARVRRANDREWRRRSTSAGSPAGPLCRSPDRLACGRPPATACRRSVSCVMSKNIARDNERSFEWFKSNCREANHVPLSQPGSNHHQTILRVGRDVNHVLYLGLQDIPAWTRHSTMRINAKRQIKEKSPSKVIHLRKSERTSAAKVKGFLRLMEFSAALYSNTN